MNGQEAMKQLVAEELQACLKAQGFRKKGLTFLRELDANYGLVQLQKSRSSTATAVEFTINVSVFWPGCIKDSERSRGCRT